MSIVGHEAAKQRPYMYLQFIGILGEDAPKKF